MRVIKHIYILVILLLLFSCNKRDNDGRNTYCEFVDGKYTFDIDLRRTLFYRGTDFDFKYYDEGLQESNVDVAHYVVIEGIGRFYDEQTNRDNDIPITYSSLFRLPNNNEIKHVNINVLTTLESGRVIYLVNSGSTYSEALKKVKREIKRQVNSSAYFSSSDFDYNIEFSKIKINNYFLSIFTSSIANMVNTKLLKNEEKPSLTDLWNDYILNYALTGDLALSSLEPKDSNSQYKINRSFDRDIEQLRVSVCNYKIPFLGGVPQVKNNKIYYGVDTNTYENKIKGLERMSIRGINHRYKKFICNGYIDISANIISDSLNYKEDLRIIINKSKSKKIDTTIIYRTNELGSDFSTLLWFEEEEDYHIKIIYGKDSLSYNISNRLMNK